MSTYYHEKLTETNHVSLCQGLCPLAYAIFNANVSYRTVSWLQLRVVITNRQAEKSATAALVPSPAINSTRSLHIPDTVAGPLGLKIAITSGMVRCGIS